jgi:ABC-type iron transport system FetAB ATPase subunit
VNTTTKIRPLVVLPSALVRSSPAFALDFQKSRARVQNTLLRFVRRSSVTLLYVRDWNHPNRIAVGSYATNDHQYQGATDRCMLGSRAGSKDFRH